VRKHLAEQKEALALEHGQKLAQLRSARATLATERSVIESQLSQSPAIGSAAAASGSSSAAVLGGSGFDMAAFVRQLQGEQGAHKARLDRLKRELNDMQVLRKSG
jgi:hypothetical protein